MLVLHVQQQGLPLPPGEYGFFEWYCTEDDCDCRRVLLQVISARHPGKVLATIDQFGPDMAVNCIKTGFRIKKGEKLHGWIKTPVKLVTAKELK